MKNIILFVIALTYINNCCAQDTVERKNRLTDSVIERFYVLKTDKNTKQGPYKALFKRQIVIAIGNFKMGKKVGTWNFYSTAGKLVETYDYNTGTLLFEAAYNAGGDVGFLFDKKIKKTDTATRPIKIGGSYYGFIPYLNLFQLPFDTFDVNTDSFDAYIELLVSPLGRLADYKVHLTSGLYEYDRVFNMDVNLLNPEDRSFIPASINHENILSRIIIKCFVAQNGTLDFF